MEESPAGEVAEMDFSLLGLVPNPESGVRNKVWTLIVVLRYSRHCFVWPTRFQTLPAMVEGFEAAWTFFGGVPRYLVIDNFPAAVAGADRYHPRFTRGFLEYSRHRGFVVDAARVRKPKDKPRVERSVTYVRERLFKGASFRDIADLRAAATRWCTEVAGLRDHGTTRRQPLVVFEEEERGALLPYDAEPYEVPDWRTAKVQLDHHIASRSALYSVPSTTCPPGTTVDVQLTAKVVRIYYQNTLIKVHRRTHRGGRATDYSDYPQELTPYTARGPDNTQRRAAELGEHVGAFATRLFEGALAWSTLRQGFKLLRLAERYGAETLDAACRRALEVDLIKVGRVEEIIVRALERETTPEESPLPPPPGRFAHPGGIFAVPRGIEGLSPPEAWGSFPEQATATGRRLGED